MEEALQQRKSSSRPPEDEVAPQHVSSECGERQAEEGLDLITSGLRAEPRRATVQQTKFSNAVRLSQASDSQEKNDD